MSDWLPIESAPKDGTEIIGLRESTGTVLRTWFFAPSSRTQIWVRFDNARAWEPSHWLPFPVISGGRGRRFDSCRSDQLNQAFIQGLGQ